MTQCEVCKLNILSNVSLRYSVRKGNGIMRVIFVAADTQFAVENTPVFS